MSEISVCAALETQLATVTFTGGQTVYENAEFEPTAGTPYQEVFTLFAKPDNPTMGTAFHRLRGIFQVNLFYPILTGRGAAQTQAGLIKAAFARGRTFTSGAVTVQIENVPYVGQGTRDGDRWMVPVKIDWYANINS